MRITSELSQLPEIGSKPASMKQENKLEFGQLLKDALYGVNDQIQQAEQAAAMLVKGEIEYHDAMIITEKANLALQLTLAIRNKIQEAYQEIMRIQV